MFVYVRWFVASGWRHITMRRPTHGAGGGMSDPIDSYFDGIDTQVERLSGTVLKPRLDALEADRQARPRLHHQKRDRRGDSPGDVLHLRPGCKRRCCRPTTRRRCRSSCSIGGPRCRLPSRCSVVVLIGIMFVMPAGLTAHLEYRAQVQTDGRHGSLQRRWRLTARINPIITSLRRRSTKAASSRANTTNSAATI